MKNIASIAVITTVSLVFSSGVRADSFGEGAYTFHIDFVPIKGDASCANGTNISQYSPDDDKYKTFTDPGNFRIGKFEITNGQWGRFRRSMNVPVVGSPLSAYDESPHYLGLTMPTNNVSWYEAAQFVNWLNTSSGNHEAYKFTGTQGQSDYTLTTWSATEADNGTNLYRHKDAKYFLPTENEWVKAAYWNGETIQTHSTPGAVLPQQGTGNGWNYFDDGYATPLQGPWDIGSGGEELNGTFDMMGNVTEWMECPLSDTSYGTSSTRALRGGSYRTQDFNLTSEWRVNWHPFYEIDAVGFRVAANIPEPSTLILVACGGLATLRRRCGKR